MGLFDALFAVGMLTTAFLLLFTADRLRAWGRSVLTGVCHTGGVSRNSATPQRDSSFCGPLPLWACGVPQEGTKQEHSWLS